MGNSCCKKSLSDRQKDSSLIYSVNSENDKVCTMQSLRFPETDAGNSGTIPRICSAFWTFAVRLPFRIRSEDLMSFSRSRPYYFISRNASHIT